MGCRARELEMSLSLDGRLPSGRRAELLRHVAQCPRCAATLQGMKKAQDLALSLPAHRVPAGFRTSLQRRIEAGEGAPDAVYRDPVPGRVKLRYLASGAAAAALLIVGLNLLVPTPPQDAPVHAAGDELAREDRAPTWRLPHEETVPLRHAAATMAFPFQPLNEQTVAQSVAESAASQARHLRTELRTVGDDRALESVWGQLGPVVAKLESSVRSLRELDRMEIVALPGSLKSELREADTLFARALHAASWEDRRLALRRLEQLQLERVAEHLPILCCRPVEDLHCDVLDLFERVPEAGRFFRIYRYEPLSPLPRPESRQLMIWVAPRD